MSGYGGRVRENHANAFDSGGSSKGLLSANGLLDGTGGGDFGSGGSGGRMAVVFRKYAEGMFTGITSFI